jgi:hypothetical protein
MQQTVEFTPVGEAVTISARDAERLVNEIRAADQAESAATKIEQASQLGESAHVDLAIGEDEAVLAALDRLEQTGDFLTALQRLQRDLRAKIDAES